MLNKVMLIGRLGNDPALKYSKTGTPACSFNIATDESYSDRDGNKVVKTEWHRIWVYQRLAENCAKYLAKGRMVYIEGKIQTRKWTDQQGNERFVTEIIGSRVQFLGGENGKKNDGQANTNTRNSDVQNGRKQSQRTAQSNRGQQARPSENFDEVPF